MPEQIRAETTTPHSGTAQDTAREILSFLPEGTWALVTDDAGLLYFNLNIRPHGWKLESILFSKPCLERLANDPLRAIKVDYLQRDIESVARTRHTWAYPHSAFSHGTVG